MKPLRVLVLLLVSLALPVHALAGLGLFAQSCPMAQAAWTAQGTPAALARVDGVADAMAPGAEEPEDCCAPAQGKTCVHCSMGCQAASVAFVALPSAASPSPIAPPSQAPQAADDRLQADAAVTSVWRPPRSS